MAILRFIIGFTFTILIAGFAVMNRFDVNLMWSPLHDSVMVPFYFVLLGALIVGFVFGGCLVWMNGGHVRRIKRQQARDIKILEKEIERLKQDKYAQSVSPAADMFPAIASK